MGSFLGCVGVNGLTGGGNQPPPGDGQADADADAAAGQDATSIDASSNETPSTLSVTRSGNGKGNIASEDLGLDCGATCSHLYPPRSFVTLTATPLAGSAFIGWGAPCSGTGACPLLVTRDVVVDGAFGLQVLDIDGNRTYESMNDGTLVSRYLFGNTGTSLTNGAIGANATRSDPDVVLAYLASIRPQLDVDGNHPGRPVPLLT